MLLGRWGCGLFYEGWPLGVLSLCQVGFSLCEENHQIEKRGGFFSVDLFVGES